MGEQTDHKVGTQDTPPHAAQPVINSVTPGGGPLSLTPYSSHTGHRKEAELPRCCEGHDGPVCSQSAQVLVNSRGGLEMRAEGTAEPGSHSRPRLRKEYFSPSPKCLPQVP